MVGSPVLVLMVVVLVVVIWQKKRKFIDRYGGHFAEVVLEIMDLLVLKMDGCYMTVVMVIVEVCW